MLSRKKDYIIQAYQTQITINFRKFMFLFFDPNDHAKCL